MIIPELPKDVITKDVVPRLDEIIRLLGGNPERLEAALLVQQLRRNEERQYHGKQYSTLEDVAIRLKFLERDFHELKHRVAPEAPPAPVTKEQE